MDYKEICRELEADLDASVEVKIGNFTYDFQFVPVLDEIEVYAKPRSRNADIATSADILGYAYEKGGNTFKMAVDLCVKIAKYNKRTVVDVHNEQLELLNYPYN